MLDEAVRGIEPSWLTGAGWDQPYNCNSLPETSLVYPWRSMVWTSQLLHTRRNLCLKPTAWKTLSICIKAGQTAMLGGIFISLCALCRALVKTNIDHCSSTGPDGLCSLLCGGKMGVRKRLLWIQTHDPVGDPFRSARGFFLLLGPICSPLVQIATLVRPIPFL